MKYEAIDRWNSPDYLQHGFKYLKKINIGGHTRYFYTPEALRAYYNADKKAANLSRLGANSEIELNRLHSNIGASTTERKANNAIASVMKAHNNVKAAIQPHTRTASLAARSALGSSKKSTLGVRAGKSLLKNRGMATVRKLMNLMNSGTTTTTVRSNGKVVSKKKKKRGGIISNNREITVY